jgi:hypothetical protein
VAFIYEDIDLNEAKQVIEQCYSGYITYDEAINKVSLILNEPKIQNTLQIFIAVANEKGF